LKKHYNTKNGIHGERLKKIRSYIDFDYDLRQELTGYQKRKIKTYYDEIYALKARPHHVYRPHSKKKNRLKAAQELAQHEKRLPGLKVAFVPTNGKDKPKIRFNKAGEIQSETEHIHTRLLKVDTKKLVSDPEGYSAKLIAKDRGKMFTVLAGRYEIPMAKSKKALPEFVAQLAMKYADTEKNNHVSNWLHGIAAHTFKNQKHFMEYQKEKQENKREIQKSRRNEKERERYHKEKREATARYEKARKIADKMPKK